VSAPEHTRELERARREQRPVRAAEGAEVGHVDALYYDLDEGSVAWIGICSETTPGARTLVPAEGVSFGHDALRIPYGRDVVARAPQVDSEELDDPTEELLAAYFGVGGRPEERDTAVLRREEPQPTEEAVAVSKRREAEGRVRMRKRVETEPVSVEVELERETARVVRVPLGVPVAGDVELGEAEIEIELYAERPVLEKQLVAAERVRIEKDVWREAASVEDELRVDRAADDSA
jgi:Domain of unknown function (DUF2382)